MFISVIHFVYYIASLLMSVSGQGTVCVYSWVQIGSDITECTEHPSALDSITAVSPDSSNRPHRNRHLPKKYLKPET